MYIWGWFIGMRLGQLARQLGVKSEDIVLFLAAQNVVIEADNNARIEDAHVDWVVAKFSPVDTSVRVEPRWKFLSR